LKGCTVTPKGRPVLSFCATFSGTLRDVSLRQRSQPASSEPPVLVISSKCSHNYELKTLGGLMTVLTAPMCA